MLDAEKFTNAKWNFEIPPEPVDESKIGNTVECEILVIGCPARLASSPPRPPSRKAPTLW
ncbi:MAG: hypothetical protein ACLSVD_04285 [Eggerthellaceae bacterium]